MTLSEQVDRFIKDTDIAHRIIHGGSSTVVMTEGGPVRSFAKVIMDADTYLISGTQSILNMVKDLIPTADELEDLIEQVDQALDQAKDLLPYSGPTPPNNPVANQRWNNTSNGNSYTWIVDIDGGQWVELADSIVTSNEALNLAENSVQKTQLQSSQGASLIGTSVGEGFYRLANSKFADWITPDDFFVIGEADYTNALKLAVTYSATNKVPLRLLGKIYVYSDTLNVPRDVKIEGVGNTSVLSYIGLTIGITTNTPNVRSYGWVFRDFTLSSTSNADVGIFYDSMSKTKTDNVQIIGFKVNVDIFSPTSGYAVYNRFSDVYVQGGIGYRLRGTSSNANTFFGCRSNICMNGAVVIIDSNDNTFNACQFESGGVNDAVVITASVMGIAPVNRFLNCRMEGNTGIGYNIGTNVTDTIIDNPMFIGALPATPILDNGLRTKRRGANANTSPDYSISAVSAASGSAYNFESTSAGSLTSSVMRVKNSNTAAGMPIAIIGEVTRLGGACVQAVYQGVEQSAMTPDGRVRARVSIDSPRITPGTGNSITNVFTASQTVAVGAIAAGASTFFDMTVPGVVTTGVPTVSVGRNNYTQTIVTGTVVSANTVRITIYNPTNAAITPVNQTYRASVMYFE